VNQAALSGIIAVLFVVVACSDGGGHDGACTNASDSEAITSYMFGDLTGPDAINESGRMCAAPDGECFDEAVAAAFDPTEENQDALSVCIGACITAEVGDLTAECSACYAEAGACGAASCATQCACLISSCTEEQDAACEECITPCHVGVAQCSGLASVGGVTG
jgi:hypothetical protein